MCTKKGFIHLVVEPSQFELVCGGSELTSYRFNTGVAEHKFCRHCGIHPFYTPRSDPDKVDVNLRCIDDLDPDQLTLRRFDGKHWEQAILSAHRQSDSAQREAVVELAVLDVRAGVEAEFEAAFARAQPIIASSRGYQRHALHRCHEREHRYLLLVWWDSVESHTVGFRGSPQYEEWRQLLHHFYEPFPTVEHYFGVSRLSSL